MIFTGYRFGFVVVIVCLAFFAVGFGAGRSGRRVVHAPVVNAPSTAAAYGESCSHGVRVYTTPQGGIAVFYGGQACP